VIQFKFQAFVSRFQKSELNRSARKEGLAGKCGCAIGYWDRAYGDGIEFRRDARGGSRAQPTAKGVEAQNSKRFRDERSTRTGTCVPKRRKETEYTDGEFMEEEDA